MAEVSRLRVVDRLRNLVSGMGTDKDKSAQAYWLFCELSQSQVEAAYRGDWMARKVIDIPPNDATREWRAWYADDKAIAAIEAVEEKHGIQQKVCEALAKARLYGGSALLLGIGDEDPSKEMDPERVTKDGLKFVHVMSRWEVQADELDRDPMSEFYGTPKMYSVTSQTRGVVKIHPTRVIRFIGSPRPSIISSVDGWGDSVLQSVQDAIKDAGSSASSIASLVAESKVDIIKIPNLSEHLSSSEYSDGLTTRFTYANTLKSTINTLLLDKEEEWERINVNFAGLPDVLKTFLLILSGAADIPATRMLGQSPAGMSATGDSDTRNYYDKIASEQNTRLAPALRRLDDVLQASALGKIDPDIYYEWNPLWQMNEQEKAEIDLKQVQTWKTDHDAGLLDPEILVEARANQIIEAGTYPGFKQIVDDHGGELLAPKEPNPFLMNVNPNDPNIHPDLAASAVKHQAEMGAQGFAGLKQNAAAGAEQVNAAQAKAKDAFNQALKDMQPRPLYVRRDLIDPTEITAWAKSQGITGLQPDLHVTICHSQTPVNWLAAGSADYGQDEDGSLTVAPGGPRVLEQWVDKKGRNILVLQFASCALAYRHADILQRTQASYDFPEYIPHITLTVEGVVDLATIEPYRGEIELGPEIFEEIKPLVEDEHRRPFASDYNPNHVAEGEHGGEFTGGGEGSDYSSGETERGLTGLDGLSKDLTPHSGRDHLQNPLHVDPSAFKLPVEEMNRLNALGEDFGPVTTEDVSISSLVSNQSGIDPAIVRDILRNKAGRVSAAHDPVNVTTYKGVNLLYDGNHRAAAAKLAGRTMIKAQVEHLGMGPAQDELPARRSRRHHLGGGTY